MKVSRLLFLSAALFWSGCADPGITVERSIFGPNGEKWCADVKDWKFVQIDPLNCGDCDQPCPLNHVCFKSKCEPSATYNDDTGEDQGPDYCEDYLECAYSGCATNCQATADCLEIEQACADQEDVTIEELRDGGFIPLQCNTTTGRCFVETPEPPDEDDPDPPVTPPPTVNKSDTCCGTGCNDCTATGQECEGSGTSYSCVCNGCEDGGQCYDVGYRRSFPDKPGYECGASCKCLADTTWGECTPLSNCPI